MSDRYAICSGKKKGQENALDTMFVGKKKGQENALDTLFVGKKKGQENALDTLFVKCFSIFYGT